MLCGVFERKRISPCFSLFVLIRNGIGGYLLPIVYLPPMAGAPPPRSGIAWDDEHSHTFEYSINYIRIHISIIPFNRVKQYLSAVHKTDKNITYQNG